MKNTFLLALLPFILVPTIVLSVSNLKTNQEQLCQKKFQNSKASTYSLAFANQFSGCKIELARR